MPAGVYLNIHLNTLGSIRDRNPGLHPISLLPSMPSRVVEEFFVDSVRVAFNDILDLYPPEVRHKRKFRVVVLKYIKKFTT